MKRLGVKSFYGFAFSLFAGNYSIYVISKNWLQVVLTETDLPFKISKGHKGINNRRHESSDGCLDTERFSMGYLVLFVISVCFAGLLYFMASKRGANKSFWAIMGFFFGPFAIPFLFLAKKVDPTNTT